LKLRIWIVGLMIGTGAFAAESGAELFQRAVTQERAAGNLDQAIKLYQRVATEFASDRALAAKALVQEARCYEKLGQSKAVKLYEQVARDYKDQGGPLAAANARLAALRSGDRPAPLPATLSQRRLEFAHAPDRAHYAAMQTDGQRMVYKNQATGAVMVSDLSGANQRVVFKPQLWISTALPTSRDFSMVGMYQTTPDGSRTTYAVVKLDGTGYRDTGINSTCRPEWSWDNRYLLLCEGPVDPARKLLKYSVADGSVKEIGTATASSHVFSPDGRFIAYDGSAGIFVMPSEGGGSQLIANRQGGLIDWTPDGRYLAVSMDRDGAEGLWLLPVKDGKPNGDAVFVGSGSFGRFGRITASGAMIYFSTPPAGSYAEWIASLDADGQAGNWKPLVLSGSNPTPPHIRWSPDGKHLVYATTAAAGQSSWVVRIRNVATGDERQIFQSASPVYCVWAGQRPKLYCSEQSSPDKTDVVSVSTESGLTERLGSIAGSVQFYFMTADETGVYARSDVPSIALMRWDIASHQTTLLEQIPGLQSAPMGMMSPDARWIGRQQNGSLEIRPFAGGAWKSVGALVAPRQAAFSPDGNWLFYRDNDAGGNPALFRVPTAGGSQPERIGNFPSSSMAGTLYMGPDGRTLIAVVFSPAAYTSAELSMLENFEPKTQAGKQ
jgi:Tol biopolymer transport system component